MKKNISRKYFSQELGALVTVFKTRAPRRGEKTWTVDNSKDSIANAGHQRSMFKQYTVKVA